MITNINIRKYLVIALAFLTAVAIADITLWLFGNTFSEFFKGYSAVIIPLLILITYIYIGLPLFAFDAKSEVLHLRSHLVLNKYLGKDVYIPRKNLVSLTVDRSGIRKKLIVRYIKNGKEFEERFSITLLSKKKLQKLTESVKDIDAEARNITNTHLFI